MGGSPRVNGLFEKVWTIESDRRGDLSAAWRRFNARFYGGPFSTFQKNFYIHKYDIFGTRGVFPHAYRVLLTTNWS